MYGTLRLGLLIPYSVATILFSSHLYSGMRRIWQGLQQIKENNFEGREPFREDQNELYHLLVGILLKQMMKWVSDSPSSVIE